MSNFFSSVGRCCLEAYMMMSSGALGMTYLMVKGIHGNFLINAGGAIFTAACLMYIFRKKELHKPSKDKVVFITGCDSGLGFSMAQHLCQKGFTVVAALLDLNSDGAKELRKICGNRIMYLQLNLTELKSIDVAIKSLELFLKENNTYKLWSLINNAGVMVFAEFEWQTEGLIQQQIEVNLIGTLYISKAMLPILRKHKGRLITITSHCSQACLPGLSVYGATKSALASWIDGLRPEMTKYGVNVINFIPGSFITQSNIMALHKKNCNEMFQKFSAEQRDFYSDYFNRYNKYLGQLCEPKVPRKIDDTGLYDKLEKALLHVRPNAKYVNEALNYKLYHFLFKIAPSNYIRDSLVNNFMQVPQFEN